MSHCETLYRCATEPVAKARELWRTYLQKRPLDDFQGPEFRLVPAVWSHLSSESGEFAEEGRAKGIYRYSLTKNAALKRQCQKVVAQLQSHGIPTIVLKGIVLTQDVHQSLGYRPAADVDLLIPYEQAESCLELLISKGWRAKDEEWVDPTHRIENAICLVKDTLELDLHWFLLREARNVGTDADYWERSVPFQCGDVVTRQLCPTDLMFHLIVCATREPENLYRYLLDIKALQERAEFSIDLEAIWGLLTEHRLLGRLNYLPLGKLGWNPPKAGLSDRIWSWCSRYVNDGRGEWVYAVFPFLDYWFHFRGQPSPGWTLLRYLKVRLQVQGIRDVLGRTWAKLRRTVF